MLSQSTVFLQSKMFFVLIVINILFIQFVGGKTYIYRNVKNRIFSDYEKLVY